MGYARTRGTDKLRTHSKAVYSYWIATGVQIFALHTCTLVLIHNLDPSRSVSQYGYMRKYLVGMRRRIIINYEKNKFNGVTVAYAAYFLMHSKLTLGIHCHLIIILQYIERSLFMAVQLFFATTIWIVSSNHVNRLRQEQSFLLGKFLNRRHECDV